MRPVLVARERKELGPERAVDVGPDTDGRALEQLLDEIVSVPLSARAGEEARQGARASQRRALPGRREEEKEGTQRRLRQTDNLGEDRVVHDVLHRLAPELLDLRLPCCPYTRAQAQQSRGVSALGACPASEGGGGEEGRDGR